MYKSPCMNPYFDPQYNYIPNGLSDPKNKERIMIEGIMIEGKIYGKDYIEGKIKEMKHLCAMDKEKIKKCKNPEERKRLEKALNKMEAYIDTLEELELQAD